MLALAYSCDLHSGMLEMEGQTNCHVTFWHCLTPIKGMVNSSLEVQ